MDKAVEVQYYTAYTGGELVVKTAFFKSKMAAAAALDFPECS